MLIYVFKSNYRNNFGSFPYYEVAGFGRGYGPNGPPNRGRGREHPGIKYLISK